MTKIQIFNAKILNIYSNHFASSYNLQEHGDIKRMFDIINLGTN